MKPARVLILAAMVLRVWWGQLPGQRGVFLRRYLLPVGGHAEYCYRVRLQDGREIVVPERDIERTDHVKE